MMTRLFSCEVVAVSKVSAADQGKRTPRLRSKWSVRCARSFLRADRRSPWTAALLTTREKPVSSPSMIFVKACLVWIIMGAALGLGLWLLAVKGSPWLFVVSVLGF